MIVAVRIGWLASSLALALSGCSETVDPTLEAEQAFTVYGYFNPRSDTQAVRVIPIGERIDEMTSRTAEVVSTDLLTGEARAWQDSLVSFEDGSRGHVFFAPFRAAYEHTYRLDVAGPDGTDPAHAETDVPPEVVPVRLAPEFGYRDLERFIDLPVRWTGAPQLYAVEVFYHVQPFKDFAFVGEPQVIRVPYGGAQEVNGEWVVRVAFLRDAETVSERVDRPAGSRVVLRYMEVRAFVASEAWRPSGGVFDEDLLVQPGAFSNVENGFGFVGGGYADSLLWLPDEEVLEQSGYLVP